MKRHLLVGNFGPKDNESVDSRSDESVTEFPLIVGKGKLNYGAQKVLEDLKSLHVFPSEVGIDLLVLAIHIHAADTRISRSSESQDTWTREIRIVVPVSDVGLWSGTSEVISRMLNFLTGDKWAVNFRERPAELAKLAYDEPNDLVGNPFDSINLFSGGLDSLIGAINNLDEGKTPLFVSHVGGDNSASKAQDDCFGKLVDEYKRLSFNRLRAKINLPTSLVPGVESEDSTRGRSFMFFALGILAGTGLNDEFTLRVPENGLIALNVPLDIVRLGSHSTRTTHPFYMARWNDLMSLLNIDGKVENPFWNKTKGEMASGCSNLNLLRQTVPMSMSCSSPTKGRWLKLSTRHCGFCLPCLIRRASLNSAFGEGNDPTVYTISDLGAQTLNTLRSEGQQVRSFQIAVERLKNRPELSKILIHKSGSLVDEQGNWDELADVYKRGMGEVDALLSGVVTTPM